MSGTVSAKVSATALESKSATALGIRSGSRSGKELAKSLEIRLAIPSVTASARAWATQLASTWGRVSATALAMASESR
jgi:hypothetical protein